MGEELKSNERWTTLDVVSNRKARKWSRKALLARVLWEMAHPLFAFSPRPLWGWRSMLLRLFGARIGRNVRINPGVHIIIPWNLTIGDEVGIGDRVILYALGPITIGSRATISQGAHLCAGSHDFRDPTMPLTRPPIHVGNDAWICADAFVGPGVVISDRAVVGARAVAVKSVDPDTIVAGNPARPLKKRIWRQPQLLKCGE